MPELVFIALCVFGVFVLAMRRAPLWAWTLGLAAAVYIWQSGLLYGSPGELEPGFLGVLAWVAVAALAVLCIPAIRRATLVQPIYRRIKGILPRVSATEQEALNAGTIGFDAELFSGKPDWDRLRAVPPITLTEEEKAFLDGPSQRQGDPRRGLGFRQEAWLPRHAHLQGTWRPRIFGAGAILDPGAHRVALA
jgi:acyl-CoA dehydrogenase